MTRKTDRLDRLAHTIADRAQRAPKPPRYSAEAVSREIDKDRRIGRVAARLIHALLRDR